MIFVSPDESLYARFLFEGKIEHNLGSRRLRSLVQCEHMFRRIRAFLGTLPNGTQWVFVFSGGYGGYAPEDIAAHSKHFYVEFSDARWFWGYSRIY